MKIAAMGAGAVGTTVTTCLAHQGQAEHIVLIDTNTARAHALALEPDHHTGTDPDHLRTQVEEHIRYANIAIIEGLGAGQYGIGTAVAALAQCVLRNERRALPVASYIDRYQVTLPLPLVVGTGRVEHVLHPPMSQDEHHNLHAGAPALRTATHHLHS